MSFLTSLFVGRFFTSVPGCAPSRGGRPFCFRLAAFLRGLLFQDGPKRLLVLMHSSNHLPSWVTAIGSSLETSLTYLTQLGTASASFLTAQFLFRVTGSARTLPEELVNPASGLCSSRNKLRGVEPTSLAQPFPSHLGLSLERCRFSFVRRP